MIEVTPLEARVLGVLIEKEITTPDQYPLSLKSLTAACNQKSNRDPVLCLSEAEVQETVDSLSRRNLAAELTFGGRIPKYKHRFCNTEFSQLHLNKKELGLTCMLLLRGAQTPGELRSRAGRLCDLADVAEVELVLQGLAEKEDGPLVVKLNREPGKRESRFMHLFSGKPDLTSSQEISTSQEVPKLTQANLDLENRVHALEGKIQLLEKELEQLKNMWQ